MGAGSSGSAASLCPGDETVARFASGSLESEADAGVRAHIDECSACRQLVAEVGNNDSGAVLSAPESDETVLGPGAIIGGKYEILKVLGAGGMGMVLAARHLELGQTVAIKVMHPELANEPDPVRRFMREGRAAALLRSDHAVRIHDVGRLPSGLPFLVMEHLVGEDLDHLRARRNLEVSEVVDYILQAISAISEAHESGLVHRDIKPQNLFLARLPDGTERVKVLDFGLAKDLAAATSSSGALTTEHMILGSPHFMSPEQIRSPRQVDARADVWALGATMVQLLTGHPPYTANNVHGLLARILADPAPRVRELRADVPVAIEQIILRCMEKKLERRYGSVIELATALQLAVGWSPSGAQMARALGAPPPESSGPPTSMDSMEVTTRAAPNTPRMAPLAVTRASPLAPTSAAASAPATVPETEPVTLHLATPAAAARTTMPAYTVPTPTVRVGEDPAPATERAHVATLAAVPAFAPAEEAPAEEAPAPKRVPRAWLIAFFLITFSASLVAVLAIRESRRRRVTRVDPTPTVVAVPNAVTPSTPPVLAPSPPPSATPATIHEPASTPPAPSSGPSAVSAPPAGPKRPKPTQTPAPAAAPKPAAPPATPPPSTPAACPSSDPYCWGK